MLHDDLRSAAIAGTERGTMIKMVGMGGMVVHTSQYPFSLMHHIIRHRFVTAGHCRKEQYVDGKHRCKYPQDHAANIEKFT